MAAKETKKDLPSPNAERTLPAEVKAAIAEIGEEPGQLLEFKVYPDRVVVVLLDYRKFTFTFADLLHRLKDLAPKSAPKPTTTPAQDAPGKAEA